MRGGPALLLALALAVAAPGAGASTPGDGTDPQLQAEMERLFALRQQDPQAFVAQARSLESLPPPTSLAQREFLQFLRANGAAFSGRFADAIALAKPLAEGAEDPKLRLRAGAFVVNLMAGTREFEAGLRLLGELLKVHPEPRPGMEAEQHVLWGAASVLYNELGQHQLAIDYAERVLSTEPPAGARESCLVRQQREAARQQLDDAAQTDADFRLGREGCALAGVTVAVHFLTLSEARFLRERQRLPEALALMEDQLGAIDSTSYPRLMAEAYALDAELLHAADRPDAAGRQARRAVELSKNLPTGLPAAMAEKVLYDLARERGDAGAALQHLQNHVVASRALGEESRIKALAFRTVQHEAMQRELELQLLGERSRVLGLQAEVARAESRNALLGLGVLVLCLVGLGAWAWRMLGQERRFRQVAHRDALTGFANRQHFNTRAEALLARAQRDAVRVTLACFDLDHFKRINDQHGHLAGDAVLRSVSAAVQAVPVEGGIEQVLGRIGGEEFAILLVGASPEAALRQAERCRAAIAGARAALDSGAVLGVTASFGVTDSDTVGYGLDTLFGAADRALYRAKSAGRDRIGTPAGLLEAA